MNWYELAGYEYNMDHSDLLKILHIFIITIDYNLDRYRINILSMITDICNSMDGNIIIVDGGAVALGFFVHIIYFIIQSTDKSSLNIQLSVEFIAMLVVMAPLMLNFAVQSSIGAVWVYTQVSHNVCTGFHSLPFLFCIFSRLYMLFIIDKICKNKYAICTNKQFEHNLMSQSIKILLVSLFLLTVHQIVLHSQSQQVYNKVVKYITQQPIFA